MKKCVISHRVYRDSHKNERRDCLDQRWMGLADALGVHMYPLPTTTRDIDGWLQTLSAECAILSGGNSLAIHNDSDIAPEKDTSETALLRWAIKNAVPVLGVCRGAQLINQYFGGTEHPVQGHKTHHSLDTKNDAFGTFAKWVNSSHGYGIFTHTLNPHADILAVSDTVVEAYHIRQHKIWAMMWHPEREYPYNTDHIKFIKTVLDIAT